MQRAIEVEENVPLALTTNFDEVCNEIIEKLSKLRDCPNRLENPQIYHLVSFSQLATQQSEIECSFNLNYLGCWCYVPKHNSDKSIATKCYSG